jgi:hypothetical protein
LRTSVSSRTSCSSAPASGRLITRRVPLDACEAAFERGSDDIKAVVEL